MEVVPPIRPQSEMVTRGWLPRPASSTRRSMAARSVGLKDPMTGAKRARFSSGLSVLDFMKRTSFLSLDDAAIRAIGPAAVALAQAEGLPAHAASVSLRLT